MRPSKSEQTHVDLLHPYARLPEYRMRSSGDQVCSDGGGSIQHPQSDGRTSP